jgi:hypothetical protein
MFVVAHGAIQQALAADSPVSGLYSWLRGRAAEAQRSTSYVTSPLMVMLTFLFFLHRELVDEPGFWIAGLIFLGLISVVVFFVGKWVLELLRAGKRH